jgi:peroxiredoxin
LVHFGDLAAAEAELREALKGRKQQGALIVLAAVPPGAKPTEDQDLDGVPLLVTEDAEGRWARAYGVAGAPATVLVGPQGDVVWREEGPVAAAKLGRALNKHVAAEGEVSMHPLVPAITPNSRAPEFSIHRGGGAEVTLRRLGGREIWLVFWSSRSEPSVRYVRGLGRALREPKGEVPLVLAVGDGEDTEGLEAMAGGERFPFPVMADPNRTIARRYGIGSWPVTVVIGRDQRIAGVHLGAPDTGDEAGRTGKPVGA